MKIYLCAPWKHREEAAQYARRLENDGHQITRDWWNKEAGDHETDKLGQLAEEDLKAVHEADYVLVLNLEKSEGKAVETGYALALKKRIGIVGKPFNIFYHLNDVEHYDTFKEALQNLDLHELLLDCRRFLEGACFEFSGDSDAATYLISRLDEYVGEI